MRLKSVTLVLLVGAIVFGIVADPVGMSKLFDAVGCKIQYAGDQFIQFLNHFGQ